MYWSSLLSGCRILPLVSHGEYANGTDRWTDARPHYIMLSTMDAARIMTKLEVLKYIFKFRTKICQYRNYRYEHFWQICFGAYLLKVTLRLVPC